MLTKTIFFGSECGDSYRAVMALRAKIRRKDGKERRNFSIDVNRRVRGGRHVRILSARPKAGLPRRRRRGTPMKRNFLVDRIAYRTYVIVFESWDSDGRETASILAGGGSLSRPTICRMLAARVPGDCAAGQAVNVALKSVSGR